MCSLNYYLINTTYTTLSDYYKPKHNIWFEHLKYIL